MAAYLLLICKMEKNRYYTKRDPFKEEIQEDSSTVMLQGEEENIVLPKVNEKYVKKDKEETPQTYIVVFSGGTEREKDYLNPILSNKRLFPTLKMEFLADDNFLKGGKPAIFDFAMQKQILYTSSTDSEQPDIYFLLTDVDEFGSWVTKEIPICREHGIKVLVSNPCFEVWLYYATRKDKFEGFIMPDDSSQLSKNVKTWCGKVVSGGLKPKKYLYCLKANIENAKFNYCFDPKLLYGGVFSTNVFELGETILPMIQDELDKINQKNIERRTKFKL